MNRADEKEEVMQNDALTQGIIGAAIEVHRRLGPGLLESVYEAGLAYELMARDIPFERQKSVPVQYKAVQLDCGFRIDLLVAQTVIVEVKAVDQLAAIHEAQLLTYLKLTSCKLGLLLNFNSLRLTQGIKRVVLGL
jgi:GxxExxY protein